MSKLKLIKKDRIMKKENNVNHFEDIVEDYMSWKFLYEKSKENKFNKELEKYITSTSEKIKYTLVIQNNFTIFSFINDYLHDNNITAKVNVSNRTIKLNNGSIFVFLRHNLDRMHSQGCCEYNCVIISEEMTNYERDYYSRRARLNRYK
ncbi:hypothetical protein AVT43_gp50 [Polaribacter phage P12002L]|uniref:Uncharacterized protein n=2 Tax=Incheonvirus TaxID=2976977 RepID=A0A0F7INA2_9CAUD|nr:hypothetical protein AVT42_gp48 [Polaribacter phage P12002S]YP_009209710.1 hypothetical protein AVT43_gp50 [Polaribacter phage P12002L]AKG94224.1 hypothetical protein P12002L_0050 [Polaribacter phage P12002L]AKG94304.1 hypothetical protein P12002S_0048 [Polaribacter phage P12002S]